ncbi:hypothetical protein EDD85DRAFT_809196 [Armillaria nabsnona]|nr:hypothetical protein EDD85DRAFT_809196 [Armillaria nabsnona]
MLVLLLVYHPFTTHLSLFVTRSTLATSSIPLAAPTLSGTINTRQAGAGIQARADYITTGMALRRASTSLTVPATSPSRSTARIITGASLARVCLSKPVYSFEEATEEFICELFEEIVDIWTWEDNCDDDYKHDDKKYYDSSCWNAYYY